MADDQQVDPSWHDQRPSMSGGYESHGEDDSWEASSGSNAHLEAGGASPVHGDGSDVEDPGRGLHDDAATESDSLVVDGAYVDDAAFSDATRPTSEHSGEYDSNSGVGTVVSYDPVRGCCGSLVVLCSFASI